jgi:hypothetical protein
VKISDGWTKIKYRKVSEVQNRNTKTCKVDGCWTRFKTKKTGNVLIT